MIYLVLILLCGVSSHLISQHPSQLSLSFLKEYETVVQGLPVQKFDALQQYLDKNCNLTIPSKVPKFSYAEFNSMLLHYCMGIRDSVERLRNDYKFEKLKDPLDEFFNRSSTIIMTDLRKISNDVCTSFNDIVLENKKSQWTENLRSHFAHSVNCNMSCATGENDNAIAEQCIFIYGLHKILHSFEMKVNSVTTTHVISTYSVKSEKSEVSAPHYSHILSALQEEMKPVKKPTPAVADKIDTPQDGVKGPVILVSLPNSPPQKSEESHPLNVDNKAGVIETVQEDPVGAEDAGQRFNVPTIAPTTGKNVLKGPSTSVNQLNQLPPKQEIIPPSKSEDEHKSGVGNVEDVNPKPQVPETDFENEYQVSEFEDEKVDEDFEKSDGPVVDPKVEPHKKVPTPIEEDFQKHIQSFGTKSVTAQEVDTEVSLMPWYLMVVFCAFLVYLSFANKKKIVAYVVEGRPSGRYGRRAGRPNTANYRKLDTNLEEAITSNCNTTSSHVIY